MFTAKVYRVLVKSAGNTHEDCYTALKVLEDWNANQGEATGKVFIPVKPVDDQCLMPEVDVLIGIVGSYIQDQEFFKANVEARKTVLLFFNIIHSDESSMKSEVREVAEFKEEMEQLCTCLSYCGSSEFADTLVGCIDAL
jgi:hypothetical protein